MAEAETRHPELVRDTFWLSAADLFSIAGGLLGQIILTHALLTEDYGLYVVLIDAFALMFLLVDAGLPTIITRDVPRSRGQGRALVHRTLRIQAVITAIFLPVGLLVGFLTWPDIPALLLLSCALIPVLHIFTYAHRSVLRALGEARQEAMVKVVERFVVTSGYAFLLWYGSTSPTHYAVAFLIGVSCSLIWAIWWGERVSRAVIDEEGENILLSPRELLLSALPFAVTLGILPLVGRMEKIFLAWWDTYSSAALFHVAYIAYLAGLSLPQALRAAFLPILGDARNEPQRTLYEVRKARRICNLLIPPGMIFGALLVWLMLPVAFPEQYNDGSLGMSAFEIFLLLLGGWAVTMLAAPTYVEVCAGPRPWRFTLMLAEAATVGTVSAVLTIPYWGLIGAIISSLATAISLLFFSILHSNTGFDGPPIQIVAIAAALLAAVIIPYMGVIGKMPLMLSLMIGILLSLTPWYFEKPWAKSIPEAE
ncbi:MAG: hypothetical protein CMB49_03085 [Euryarchaeota archaeon]|nr:hypothetical protein [Euryarchaeota archaeon]